MSNLTKKAMELWSQANYASKIQSSTEWDRWYEVVKYCREVQNPKIKLSNSVKNDLHFLKDTADIRMSMCRY